MHKKGFVRVQSVVLSVLATCLLSLVVACGGGGDGGGPGASASIKLEVDPSTIPADGTSASRITATVTDSNGEPVRHYTDVTFSTNLGRFRNGGTTYTVQTQPPLDEEGKPDTDADPTGIAEVALISGSTAGTAKVSASSNAVTQSAYVNISGDVIAIQLTANPENIAANGSSSTQITATLHDASGQKIPAGTKVTFKTGLGHFANGQKTITVSTPEVAEGQDSQVSVSMIAGVVPGTTYVQATANEVTQALSLVMTKTDPLYAGIDVEADPSRIKADGQSQSVITATLTQTRNMAEQDKNIEGVGQPISDVPITFYKITSNVEPQPLPEANTYKGTGTSIAGPFYSYGGLIVFTMTAIPGELRSPYFIVWLFNPLSGTRINLVEFQNFSCEVWDDKWHCETITKTVSKSPLPGNYQLEIQTNCSYEIKVVGDIGPAQTGKVVLGFGATNAAGEATYTYTADWLPGSFNVKGETGELSNSENALSQETTITQTPETPAAIEINSASEFVYANGQESTTVTAQVWTEAGNKAPDGTVVYFSTTAGTIDASSVTVDGLASAQLISVASATSIASTVTATAGNNTASTTVTFVGVSLLDMQGDPSTIFANGSDTSTITVRLRDASGNAVEAETIQFSTTLGSLSPSTAVTNASGIGSVTLIAPTTTGTATITAKYGLITATTQVTFTDQPVVGNIVLNADPATIPADGSSSSTITATVTKGDGNPVSKGTSVNFTTDLGSFSNGAQSYTVVTPDETGVVSVSLIAGTTAGSAQVTATSGGVTQSIYVGIGGSLISIVLSANPTTIPADGSSSSTITATLTDGSGEPVTAGTQVTFTTDLGTFGNNTNTISTSTIGDTGEASVSLIAGTTAGTATVTCSSGGVSQNVTVTFTGGQVGSIEVTANPTSITADGSSTSTITAVVKSEDNQVIAGSEVVFTTTRGSITSPHTTDDKGRAVATLTSEKYVDPSVEVRASSQGVTATVLVSFTGLSLTLEASPTSLLTGDSSEITATLKDGAGIPISNVSISFSTDKGTLSPVTPQITDASGRARVSLTSSTSGTATVTATAQGATGSVSVAFTSYLFRFLDPDPATIRVGGEAVELTTELLDNGVPRSGETVYFSTTLGTLNPYNKVTDANGRAKTELTSGTQSGVAVIDAEVTVDTTQLTATTQVVITGGDAEKIVLKADPEVINTSTGVSTITASVYDANDQPAPYQDIYFRINSGPGGGESLSASIKTTNAYGVAVIYFYAGSIASALDGVEIEANTQPDFSGSYGLTYVTIAGPVANIGVGMNLETLEPVGANLEIDISGIATDVSGNPVADGTKVYFSVTAIAFDEDRDNDLEINCWDDNKNSLVPCPPVGTAGFGYTWFSDDVNQDGTMYSLGGPMSTTEDVNHNGILDPGEDKNDNGVIDPIQGCTIDESVETENGVANATLVYPMPQANNIKVRVTAESGGVSNFYETILLCTETMVDQGTCGIGY